HIALDQLLVSDVVQAQLPEIAELLCKPNSLPGDPTIILVSGSSGAGRQTVASAVCNAAGHQLFAFEPVETGTKASIRLRSWLRDIRLADGVPGIYLSIVGGEQRAATPELTQALHELGFRFAFIFADSTTEPPLLWPDGAHVICIKLEMPNPAQRRKAWIDALAELGAACSDKALEGIAAVYALSVGNIRRAARDAVAQRRLAQPDATRVDFSGLAAACRARISHRLEQLAQRAVTAYGWHDLVLPPDALQRLREIAGAVRNREQVLDRWGFGRVGRGAGITALFFGPSGTGKTMAASIIANDLGMDIYRVDLSRVVSKY